MPAFEHFMTVHIHLCGRIKFCIVLFFAWLSKYVCFKVTVSFITQLDDFLQKHLHKNTIMLQKVEKILDESPHPQMMQSYCGHSSEEGLPLKVEARGVGVAGVD